MHIATLEKCWLIISVTPVSLDAAGGADLMSYRTDTVGEGNDQRSRL